MMRDDLFDEAARILASPVPRRRALRLLGGALVAAIVGTIGSTRAGAQTCSPACLGNQKCCPGFGGGPNFCVAQNRTCCGNTSCAANQTCCGTGPGAFCRNQNQTCCGSTACNTVQGQVCCGTFCRAQNQTCCGTATACSPSQTCCTTAPVPFCRSQTQTCCGTIACNSNQTCCNNVACCGPNQRCVNSACEASTV
jgi:hypothetical protein